MFENSKAWTLALAALKTGMPLLIHGKRPGTGKTSLPALHCKNIRKPLYVVNVTPETSAAEILGHYMPGGDGGKFFYHYGVLAEAMGASGKPGMLLVNEIDKAGPDLEALFHFGAEDMRVAKLTLPTGELLTPKSGYQIVATMNGELFDLSAPLLDRFALRVNVNEPNPEAVASLPESLRPFATGTVQFDGGNFDTGMRALVAFSRLLTMREYVDEADAADLVFGARGEDFMTAWKLQNAPAAPAETPAPETPEKPEEK